jgi:exonuclease III
MSARFLLFCLVCVIYNNGSPPARTDSITTIHGYNQLHTPTASNQFGHLNTLPIHFFLRTRHASVPLNLQRSTTVALLLILSGDIQLNPGPSSATTTLGTLNIRSLFQQDRSVAIHDMLQSHDIKILALCETWQNETTTTPAQLGDITPPGYQFIGQPRKSKSSLHSCGGGLGFLVDDNFKTQVNHLPPSPSFESLAVTINSPSGFITVYNVYRPPDSSSHSTTFATFLSDFSAFLSLATTNPHEFLITGDFNIHVNNQSDSHAKQFLDLLASHSLQQHVSFPTHDKGNTLDLIILPTHSSLHPVITSSPTSPSDHFLIITVLDTQQPPPRQARLRSFRRINSINVDNFISDVSHSTLITDPPANLEDLISCYNSTLTAILDTHAPLQTKPVRSTKSNPWFTPALRVLKSARRRLERKWKSCKSSANLNLLHTATNFYHKSITAAKRLYHSNLISANQSDPRKLWQIINSILHRNKPRLAPSNPAADTSTTAQSFASFFSDKISRLQSSIPPSATTPHTPDPPSPPVNITSFQPATIDEITRLINSSPNKQCDLDPIPTSLLKDCLSILAPIITDIVNMSLVSGSFPSIFKQSIVTPLIKKASLDPDNLANYRPISNLSLLSKLTERIVKDRLQSHLSRNSMFNTFQSAYRKFHSTETTLLALHDYLIRAISRQQVTCLCLLDLSAAFDTIDHSILLRRLTDWFGITGTAHLWFQSYLSSRSFTVSSDGHLSTSTPLACGVPQGSVLGPLLFIIYTTPLSTLLSKTTVDHHLYADDTQLFISFSPSQFSTSINHLQSTFSDVSSWMSANLLSLNPSKTEFLVIGLPQQLAKLTTPTFDIGSGVSIHPVEHARNLGFIIDMHLNLDKQISAVSRSCSYHLRDLRRIRSALDYNTARTIATSLIHSKLDYCNSLYLGLPACHLNKLQVIQNNTARAITCKKKFDHITPALYSLHWLKIQQRIEFKIISITYTALQFGQPTYLRQLLTIQPTRSTRSGSLVTLVRPSTPRLKKSDRSFYFKAPALWNSLPAHLRQPSSPSNTNSDTGLLALPRRQFLAHLKTHLFHQSYPP